jgi:hypothetical protein
MLMGKRRNMPFGNAGLGEPRGWIALEQFFGDEPSAKRADGLCVAVDSTIADLAIPLLFDASIVSPRDCGLLDIQDERTQLGIVICVRSVTP